MNKTIKVYTQNQYTKKGKLKKNAKPSYLSINEDNEKIVKDIKEKYYIFEKPYFFTHIKAINKETKENVYIEESIGEFMTSPVTLYNLLNNN